MEYPTFYVDEYGNVTSDMPDTLDSFGFEDNVQDSSENVSGSDPLDEEIHPTVSGGDLYYIINSTPDPDAVYNFDSETLNDISDNLERILQEQASTAGYLSTSALETFDRVVKGCRYDYHIAFRYDSDNYNAIMYLSDAVSVSGRNVILEDALSVRLYRTYNSSTRTYAYHYATSSAGDVSVNLGTDLMYYTNCVPGFPVLGDDPSPGYYPGWFIPLAAVLVIVTLISLVRRRN